MLWCETRAVRYLIVPVLVAATVAGCSPASHTGAPAPSVPAALPRPEPPFLPTSAPPGSFVARFPCPKHPYSQLDFESCSLRRILALNSRANKQIRLIWSRLGDRVGRRFLVSAERAWKIYARNACTSQSRSWATQASPHQYVGGTIAPLNYLDCQENLARAHVRALTATAKALAPR
jgi:uncharacterized protein YecT (DUF1311 family)